ncbi:MAG: hypothetical protein ACJZ1Z_00970, partial [Acidimicrobiales bacterium]
EHEHEHEHEHGGVVDVIDLSSVADPPAVSVAATLEGEGGVMLEIELENFELVPLETKSGNQPRQGHLHVELDGATVAMISENHYYLSNLVNGHHEISVSLSAIDHRNYFLDGKPISDSVMVMIEGGEEASGPDISFEVEIVGGKVKGGLSRFEVSKGDSVEVIVYSDQIDEVHLHVYDKMKKVEPGVPAVIRVDATIPGIFEAELHSAGFRIFELQVS